MSPPSPLRSALLGLGQTHGERAAALQIPVSTFCDLLRNGLPRNIRRLLLHPDIRAAVIAEITAESEVEGRQRKAAMEAALRDAEAAIKQLGTLVTRSQTGALRAGRQRVRSQSDG